MQELMSIFHTDAYGMSIYTAAYLLGYAVLQPFYGLVVNRYGSKSVLFSASILCLLGTILELLNFTDFYTGCLARFLMGLGSGSAFIVLVKICYVWFEKGKRALLIGCGVAFSNMGFFLGNMGFSYFVGRIGIYNSYMARIMIGGLLVLLIGLFFPKDSIKEEDRISLSKLKNILRERYVWLSLIWIIGIYASMSIFSDFWGQNFFKEVYHLSQFRTTHILSLFITGFILGNILIIYLANQFKEYNIFLGIIGILLLTLLLLLLSPDLLNIKMLYILCFIAGFLMSSELIGYIFSFRLYPQFTGFLASFFNSTLFFFYTLDQYLFGKLLSFFGAEYYSNGVPHYVILNYRFAFLLCVVQISIATFVAFFMKKK